MNTDFQKDFDANFANLREFTRIQIRPFPFATVSEIRVNSASVFIRVHPWLNCRFLIPGLTQS